MRYVQHFFFLSYPAQTIQSLCAMLHQIMPCPSSYRLWAWLTCKLEWGGTLNTQKMWRPKTRLSLFDLCIQERGMAEELPLPFLSLFWPLSFCLHGISGIRNVCMLFTYSGVKRYSGSVVLTERKCSGEKTFPFAFKPRPETHSCFAVRIWSYFLRYNIIFINLLRSALSTGALASFFSSWTWQ